MTGSVSSGPVSDALTCAGMSSAPSSVCVHGKLLGDDACRTRLRRSRRTSGEAFSFSVSDALRVLEQQVAEADAQVAELGQRADDLARDEVEAARPRLEDDLTLGPHRSTIVPAGRRRAAGRR